MKKMLLVTLTSILTIGGVWVFAIQDGKTMPAKQPSEGTQQVVKSEEELVSVFSEKEAISPKVQTEAADNLLSQIKSEQPAFNHEGHGYFTVSGDSMTPNFYEGETVKFSADYTDGDFVALTVNATGEHLLKQLVDGELVSSNASGAYYKREDVTIHGKVERVQKVAMDVKQTLTAATGIYVVDMTDATTTNNGYGSIYVLLSNGDVYARYGATTYDPASVWGSTDAANYGWVKNGISLAMPSGVTSISITNTTTDSGYGAIYVMLSNGDVYARYGGTTYDPASVWGSTDAANYGWIKNGIGLPQALVAPPTGGTASVPQDRLVGRVSSGAGDAEYLTAAQTKTLLGIDDTKPTDTLYYPVGTTAGSVGMVEVKSYDANTKVWRSTKGTDTMHHKVVLYALPTSTGDLRIN